MKTNTKPEEKKEVVVELKWKWLEQIAKYYEFPTAVFLLSNTKLKGTRKDSIRKMIEAYSKKINEATDELVEQL